MTPLPASPFIIEPAPFVFDEAQFCADIGIEPMPVFLSDPSPAFLSAAELEPLVEILTKF